MMDKKYIILPFEYHGKNEKVLISFKSTELFHHWEDGNATDYILHGVNILGRKGDDVIVDKGNDHWTFNGNLESPPLFEFKVTDRFLIHHILTFEDDDAAKLYFELEV